MLISRSHLDHIYMDVIDCEYSRMPVGFMTLREFVVQRPSLRAEALNILLELTTHPGM